MAWLREIDVWFAECVLPHAAHYRAYARKLADNDSDAEDLVQEAYAKVLTHSEWRGLEAPERFVFTVIRNLAFDRFRKEKVVGLRQIGQLELNAVPDPTPDAHAHASARQELEIVLKAFEQLPKQCRRVLSLRKMHGWSPGQIATSLNLSISTVEKHIAKGLKLLTAILAANEVGTDSTPVSQWRRPSQQKEIN